MFVQPLLLNYLIKFTSLAADDGMKAANRLIKIPKALHLPAQSSRRYHFYGNTCAENVCPVAVEICIVSLLLPLRDSAILNRVPICQVCDPDQDENLIIASDN